MAVEQFGMTFYFSYKTIVAFWSPKCGMIVRKNEWGPTTGKHMRAIEGGCGWHGDERLDSEAFVTRLNEVLTQHVLELGKPRGVLARQKTMQARPPRKKKRDVRVLRIAKGVAA